MATKPKTHVAIILDKSGSMESTKAATVAAFNEQVQQLKLNAVDQDIDVSLVTFNADVFEHLWMVPAGQLAESKPEDYNPEGGTAMLDAVGYAVTKLLQSCPGDKDAAFLVITISDGETNSDRHYNGPALREIITGCQGTKRWTFTYIGHSEQYLTQLARRTGVPLANVAQWSNRTGGTVQAASAHLNARQDKYFQERALGASSSESYGTAVADSVADYTSDAVEDNAPIVADLGPAVEMDVAAMLNGRPAAVAAAVNYLAGTSPLASEAIVKWMATEQ